MNRPPKSRRRFLALAVGLVALATAAPASSAASTAQDEYTLDFPGYGDNAGGRVVVGTRPDATETGAQGGVSGESEDAPSPLGSAVATLGDGTVLAIGGAALLLVLAIMATVRARPHPAGRR